MTSAKLKTSASTHHSSRQLIAGRYRVLDRIGRGRLGEIFAATDEGCEESGAARHVAIQIAPESLVRNNRLFNRINLGYSTLRAAAHPNIVNFLHFGRDGKLGFLAMELLDGVSLRFVLDDTGTLPLDEAKPVIRGVGEALRLLHDRDMVHGNLTARNVFITGELEVRLLDVLPLDSAPPAARSATTSTPFSRHTVEDDVFGLACLAYEMLAGKHPFNGGRLAEARMVGRDAERILSLNDREWSALRRALSFDPDLRTSSIADFQRDFGVGDTERLRRTVNQPAGHEPVNYRAMEVAPPITRVAAPANSTPTVPPVADLDPLVSIDDRPPHVGPINKGSSPRRAILLGVMLAGIVAWSSFGQPEKHITKAIGYIDHHLNVGLPEQLDVIVGLSTPDRDQAFALEPVPPADRPATIAATIEVSPEEPDATHSEPQRAPMPEETDAPQSAPNDQILPTASPDAEITTVAHEGETSHSMDAEPLPPEPRIGFTAPVVSVSERDGVARIAPPRTENSGRPLIWWTSEHTAKADTDFIAVERRIMTAVTNDDGSMLHVPLVNDSLPEATESFFVSLGFRDPRQGHIERIATVRVDIVDDD